MRTRTGHARTAERRLNLGCVEPAQEPRCNLDRQIGGPGRVFLPRGFRDCFRGRPGLDQDDRLCRDDRLRDRNRPDLEQDDGV